LRVVYVPELGGAPVEREIARVVSRAANTVETADPGPELLDLSVDDLGLSAWSVLAGVELRDTLRSQGMWPDRADELGRDLRLLLEELETIGLLDVLTARASLGMLEARLRGIFRAVDVLLTPATAVAAPPRGGPFLPVIGGRDGSATGPAPFSPIANLCGSPAVVIPVGQTSSSLPIGMQLLGAPGSDRTLLDLASTLLSETGTRDAS
jgi:Asp-tRNA(Asn)/Glu-tRNA(Gln) amidotransferase A subunit family amidase